MGELLTGRGLTKKFGAVTALDNFDFDLNRNEIVGLVGDNAAGKSTFLKTVYGIYRPQSGKIYIKGKESTIDNTSDARDMGIEIVFQDFMLCPDLKGIENIFLGREKISFGLLRKDHMKKLLRRALEKVGFEVDVEKVTGELSGGQQQLIAIIRLFLFEPDILLLDEPTANLSKGAAKDLIENLVPFVREMNAGIIYVSHNLEEVISISDRIIVMRRGENVAEIETSKVTVSELLRHMMARE
ncbi:sugar ABC transporter ATP-binding protein [Candidatus Aerophobetes bacterium]|uniref:Sugar ABC transporter ATP-binding protein n=1 Tax=Aerophobetes bacterium TaxID=2030807 RepID=A0A523UYH9_UNCAE|nr:MAG: sugar ABC transporter ATP-binding protein [Candidatus Aerophobetes bacterium]